MASFTCNQPVSIKKIIKRIPCYKVFFAVAAMLFASLCASHCKSDTYDCNESAAGRFTLTERAESPAPRYHITVKFNTANEIVFYERQIQLENEELKPGAYFVRKENPAHEFYFWQNRYGSHVSIKNLSERSIVLIEERSLTDSPSMKQAASSIRIEHDYSLNNNRLHYTRNGNVAGASYLIKLACSASLFAQNNELCELAGNFKLFAETRALVSTYCFKNE